VSVARSGNCTTLATESAPAPNSSLGALVLSRVSATVDLGIPGIPGINTTTGILSGAFTRYGAVASGQLAYPPPGGGCIVDITRNDTTSVNQPDASAGVVRLLDAGTLTYTPPGGAAQTIPRDSTTGTYSLGPTATNTSGLTINAGLHAVRGAGGADIGAFSTSYNIAALFNGSLNISNSTIVRATGFTPTWTGCPDPNGSVLIMVVSLNTTTHVQGTLVCSAACSARSFPVSPSLLSQLPASSVVDGVGTGFAALTFYPSNPSIFTATGLDRGVFLYSDTTAVVGVTVQ
jgi:hypothetical protein